MVDCKQQILKTIPDNNCCSHAFLSVLLSQSNINSKNNEISFPIKEGILDKVSKIIKNFYPDLNLSYGEGFLIVRGNIFNLLLDCGYNAGGNVDFSLFSSECDRLTLLKTLFIQYGSLYYNEDNFKNTKGYLLEFVIKDNLDELCSTLLNEFGFKLKSTIRQNNRVIYTKNSNVITDLLVKLGDSVTALDIQNSLLMREIRNSTNRQNNCFDHNLDKTLNASSEQLTAINYLMSHNYLDLLDEKLTEVAMARLANPDVSLKDLQTIIGGKISRAGIKYRLDKIISIYKSIIGGK